LNLAKDHSSAKYFGRIPFIKFNFDFLFSGLSASFSKSYSKGAYILASSSDNLIPFSISYLPD
jgi:hypothetical protein